MTRALTVALCLLAWPASAEPGRVVSVIDGDTLSIALRASVVKVRLATVDTPEVGRNALCVAEARAGEAASAFVRSAAPVGSVVDVRKAPGRDPYGRYLGHVMLNDGRDLAAAIIGAGHGVPYAGRGPKAAERLGLCR
mgnify:FL=1